MENTAPVHVPSNATLSVKNIAKDKSIILAVKELMHATQKQRMLTVNIAQKTLTPMAVPSFAQKIRFCAQRKWTFLDVKSLPCVSLK